MHAVHRAALAAAAALAIPSGAGAGSTPTSPTATAISTATATPTPTATAAVAAAPGPAEPTDDPVLSRLLSESLAARPELKQAEAEAIAERERAPQAEALPDPVLSLGIQNDGFDGIQIGKMETSYYLIMLTQPLPWPGKRGLRADVSRLGASRVEAGLTRARLSAEADVRRAYLGLLLARDRLALLGRLELIWRQSAGVARARYETGEGAQSDVLRAQLEQNRLRQRRWSLEAEARAWTQTLNRLRGRPLEEEIATARSVRDLRLPALDAPGAGVADALARSPELAAARLGEAQAEKASALARRDRYPDFTVSAGLMPRGSLVPMWQATVGVTLPIWGRQASAAAEAKARATAGARGAEAVDQVVRLRAEERRLALATLLDALRLYREGLLVQSQATSESTLAQYRVGKVTFASVLEANAVLVADEDGYLQALADAQRLAIAAAEVSLDPAVVAGGGTGGASVPGAGAVRSAGGGAAPSGGGAAAPDASSSMNSM